MEMDDCRFHHRSPLMPSHTHRTRRRRDAIAAAWLTSLALLASPLAATASPDPLDETIDPPQRGYGVVNADDWPHNDAIDYEDNIPHIPEPMVFDLVRGLDAKAGEFEFNTLGMVPLRRKQDWTFTWAPEVEYAITDGFAVELELPMANDHIHAFKAAVQVTFEPVAGLPMAHGAQQIVEYVIEDDVLEMTSLYLVGFRFSHRWSMLAMLGLRNALPMNDNVWRDASADLIQNTNLFFQVNHSLTFGIETNLTRSMSGDLSLLLAPQMHWNIVEHFKVQLGAGLEYSALDISPYMSSRLITEF
jgi:hypothetical protein